jgi:hypothetical protein
MGAFGTTVGVAPPGGLFAATGERAVGFDGGVATVFAGTVCWLRSVFVWVHVLCSLGIACFQ